MATTFFRYQFSAINNAPTWLSPVDFTVVASKPTAPVELYGALYHDVFAPVNAVYQRNNVDGSLILDANGNPVELQDAKIKSAMKTAIPNTQAILEASE